MKHKSPDNSFNEVEVLSIGAHTHYWETEVLNVYIRKKCVLFSCGSPTEIELKHLKWASKFSVIFSKKIVQFHITYQFKNGKFM